VKWPDKISCQSLSAHTRETGEWLNNLMGDFLYIMSWTVLNYNARHCNFSTTLVPSQVCKSITAPAKALDIPPHTMDNLSQV
jgi:hypothetical protein